MDRLGVLAVGPATLQVGGTIDVIIVRASKGEVIAQGDSRADRCFFS
jgi:hypothetical protein